MNSQVPASSRAAAAGFHEPPLAGSSFAVHMPEYAADGSPARGPTYNAKEDVVFRFEVLSEAQLLRLFKVVHFCIVLGIVVSATLAAVKMRNVLNDVKQAKIYSSWNLMASACSLITMSACTTAYVTRLVGVTQRGLHWSERRRKIAVLLGLSCGAQTLNTFFYFLPNALFILFPNAIDDVGLQWFLFARLTMWNTLFVLFIYQGMMFCPWVDKKNCSIGREDAILLDAQWTHSWPVLVIWLVVEGVLLLGSVAMVLHLSKIQLRVGGALSSCAMRESVFLLIGLVTGAFVIIQLIGLAVAYRSYQGLLRKPYEKFRGTNVGLRYHVLLNGTVGDFVVLSMILLFWPKYGSCATEYLTFLGLLPPQFVMTALCAIQCILGIPVKPGRAIQLTKRQSQMVWTEEQVKPVGRDPEGAQVVSMFCYELSVKLWYWSMVMYSYNPRTQQCREPQYPLMSFPLAMRLFGLTDHEFMEEADCDTKVIIAWNNNTILMSFRSTYSATNMWADLQFWRVVHPPKRGSYILRTQPLMHRGYLACWKKSNLNRRVMDRVMEIIHSDMFDRSQLRVLATGHSLGGALAVLASYDLTMRIGTGENITCYTYGAPRVGNHAFVREYNSLVSNTWQVRNDEDIVPSIPKFFVLFKHVGQKVIINGQGGFIVEPHAIELSMYRFFTIFKRRSCNRKYLLLSYRSSFVAICEAQLSKGKEVTGGFEAMSALLNKRDKVLLDVLNMDLEKLREIHRLGGSA